MNGDYYLHLFLNLLPNDSKYKLNIHHMQIYRTDTIKNRYNLWLLLHCVFILATGPSARLSSQWGELY